MTTPKSFAMLTAGDLMTRDLVLVPHEMSIRGAAKLLLSAGVSGAPVIDADGRCIGVLSSTDFVRRAREKDDSSSRPPADPGCFHASWQMIDVEELPSDRVSTYMNEDPATVGSHEGITDLARKMVDAHIHRLVVVDPQGRPIGVVSSTDVLAAVARAEFSSIKLPRAADAAMR